MTLPGQIRPQCQQLTELPADKPSNQNSTK